MLITSRSITLPSVTISLDEQLEQQQTKSGRRISDEIIDVVPAHVFISYSRKDTAAMQWVVDALRNAGIPYWIDEQLKPGTPNWSREIESAVGQASAIIVLLSPDAKESVWVRRELDQSRIQQKLIIPVLINGDERSAIPFELAAVQYADARGDKFAEGMAALISAIRNSVPEFRQAQVAKSAPPETQEPYFFIDYSRKDSEIALRLTRDLQAAGVKIWMDIADLQVGTQSWEKSIRTAIQQASGFFSLASPNAVDSPYIQGELEIARQYHVPIHLVWVGGEEWVESVSLGYVTQQYIDARGDRYDAALQQIIEIARGQKS